MSSELRQRKPLEKPEDRENKAPEKGEENKSNIEKTEEDPSTPEKPEKVEETKKKLEKIEKKDETSWVEWAWDESHEMMLGMIPGIPGESTEEKLTSSLIKQNPIYWVAWLATALMLVGGRLVHLLFGQSGKVRPDEFEAEHEVRVQWIYANDVLYFASMVMDIWALGQEIDLLIFHKHVADGHSEALGVLIGTVLLTVTVFGNVGFYSAMRKRDQLGVRAAVAGNAGFAVIMTGLMSWGMFKRIRAGKALKLLSKSWAMRGMSVVFAIMAVPCYGKLWNVYEEKPGTTQLQQLIVVLVPFFGAFSLVLAAYLLDHHALWETFG